MASHWGEMKPKIRLDGQNKGFGWKDWKREMKEWRWRAQETNGETRRERERERKRRNRGVEAEREINRGRVER